MNTHNGTCYVTEKMFLKNLNTAIVVVTDIDDNKQRGGKDKEERKKERKWRSKKHKVMGKPRQKEMIKHGTMIDSRVRICLWGTGPP